MTFDRPVCYLDLEATGTDPATARIISVGVDKRLAEHALDAVAAMHTYYVVNPGCPIPQEVQDLTKITHAMADAGRPFSEYAAPLWDWIKDSYLIGFNIAAYDLPLLCEEMLRCGVDFDFPQERVIDCGVIFKKKHPRTLEAAHFQYVGPDTFTAHNALADAMATGRVMAGQLICHPDLGDMTTAQLAAFSRHNDRVDYAGKLYRDAQGDVCYAIGKAKDTKVRDDTGFGYWMLGKDFPMQTKRVLEKVLDDIEQTKQALFAAENAANNPNAGGELPF